MSVKSVVAIDAKTTYGTALLDGFRSVADAPSVAPPGFQGATGGIYVVSPTPADSILDVGPEMDVFGADAQITGSPPETTMPGGSMLISGPMAPSQLPDGDAASSSAEEGRFWAYGYEAMAVVLDSIDRADDPLDRGSVVDAFFATTDHDSILGTYSIDDVGDTTLSEVGAYRAGGDGSLTPAPEPLSVP
jgi:hypothetical protein